MRGQQRNIDFASTIDKCYQRGKQTTHQISFTHKKEKLPKKNQSRSAKNQICRK